MDVVSTVPIRLQLDNLTYRIGSAPILQGITTELPPAGIVGLIGPNGAGKSTLIRALIGLIRPSAGAVLLNGRPVTETPERQRARFTAMMPQTPDIGFGFTVAEVVAMGRHPHLPRLRPLTDRCRTVIAEAMETTGIAHLAGRRTTELSGGERQRVFLARALAQEPRLLLLDEPIANLDIKYQLEILELIQKLQQKRRMLVIMAIHDLTWALRVCTHLLVLKQGRLVAAGPTSDVLTEELVEDVFGVRARLLLEATGEPRLDVLAPL